MTWSRRLIYITCLILAPLVFHWIEPIEKPEIYYVFGFAALLILIIEIGTFLSIKRKK